MNHHTYTPTYIKTPTNRFILVGTVPSYMTRMVFTTEAIAQEALTEALHVLATCATPPDSKFVAAFMSGIRLI